MALEQNSFVEHLEQFRDQQDTAVLACLRRGLGKRMGTPEMYPLVVPFLPKASGDQELYFLVASLFALHPAPAPRGRSLGAVLRIIATTRTARDGTRSKSIENRFVHLLQADPEEIRGMLRQVVSLAKSEGVGIDYHRLLSDLHQWEHPRDPVQRNWATDFWGKGEGEPFDHSGGVE
jgi:CRISPR system Cascade subunit CasB